MQFVIPNMPIKGVEGILKSETQDKNQPDGIILKATAQGETDTLHLLGGEGRLEPMEQTKIGDFDISLRYGSKIWSFLLPSSWKILSLKNILARKTEEIPVTNLLKVKFKL